MTPRMLTLRALPAILVAIVLAPAVPMAAQPAAKIRIGTFDSRLVAMAYYRSAPAMAKLQSLRNELQEASATKDLKRVEELEAMGPAYQNLVHQQVFGNLSIPNVLATVQDSLPAVASKAGVDLLVSKWELHCNASQAELVDVTQQMIDLFDVDEATRKSLAKDMHDMPGPLPVEELLLHND